MRYEHDTWRLVKAGALFGLAAGLAFAAVQMVTAVALREAPDTPLRMAASVLLGRGALAGLGMPAVVSAAMIVHLGVSALAGALYGALCAALTRPEREASWHQAALGAAFGMALWLVDFQIFARLVRPWLVATPQVPQVLIHAVFFGALLGLGFAHHEREEHLVRTAAVRATTGAHRRISRSRPVL